MVLEHPAWCYPAWCDAYVTDHGYIEGDHHRCVRSMPKCEGGELNILLTTEAMSKSEDMRVLLLMPLSDHSLVEGAPDTSRTRRQQGQRIALEPEEARMLARFLVEVADAWERITGAAA